MQNVSTPLSVSDRDDTFWFTRWKGNGKATKLAVFREYPWLLYLRWQPSGLVRIVSSTHVLATHRTMLAARLAVESFLNYCGGSVKLLRDLGVRP